MGNCFQVCSSTEDDDDGDDDSLIADNVSVPRNRHLAEANQMPQVLQRAIAHTERPTYFTPVHAPSSQEDDERLKLAQRMGFIYQLPTGVFDGSKKARECAICMVDFEVGEQQRFLPCMHVFHKSCIDDWLIRSFTCPSCMEPVDAALLSSFGCSDD